MLRIHLSLRPALLQTMQLRILAKSKTTGPLAAAYSANTAALQGKGKLGNLAGCMMALFAGSIEKDYDRNSNCICVKATTGWVLAVILMTLIQTPSHQDQPAMIMNVTVIRIRAAARSSA